MATRWTYINGDILETSLARVQVEDRAFQFGDGVYEVIRIAHGRLFARQRHMARMKRGAAKINLSLDDAVLKKIYEAFDALMKKQRVEFGQLYIQLTRGVAPRLHQFPRPNVEPTLVLTASELPLLTLEDFENGETAVVVRDDRWLHCDIKSTSLLANVLAKEQAVSRGAQEAILARDGRIVTEGSSSNVFMVKQGTLHTHPDGDLILSGITKDLVKILASQLNIRLVEEPFTVEALRNADEVFITSTLHDVCPVLKIDDKAVGDGKPGPVARSLSAAFIRCMTPKKTSKTSELVCCHPRCRCRLPGLKTCVSER